MKNILTMLVLVAIVLCAQRSRAQTSIDINRNTKGTLALARGGTGSTSFTAGKCVRVAGDGAKLESAPDDCGTGGGPGGTIYYQTLLNAASALAQRATLNFSGGIACVDNPGASRTDCQLADLSATYLPLHSKADTAGAADTAATLATGADRTKLDGIAAGATVGADWNSNVANKPSLGDAAAKNTGTTTGTVAAGDDSRMTNARTPTAHAGSHVTGGSDVIAGAVAAGNAGLMTGADKTKLDGIASGAEVNVNADWNAGSGDAQILNKPTLAADKSCTGTDKVSAYSASTGQFTCSADQLGEAGGGITSLNGATVASQTFVNGANISVSTNTGTGAHTIAVTGLGGAAVLNVGTTTGTVAAGDDSRMTNARTPTAHASAHVTGGSDVIAGAIAAGNAGLMTGADKTKLDGIAAGATVGVAATRTLTAGAGLAGGGDLSADRSFATDSTEADFLASGALTCGASTQGKMKVHTTPLQYCDNAATPTLRYSAYADSAGKATSAATADSANAVTWANVNKATSSVADITTRTCSTLSDAGSGCSATIANYVPTSTTVNGHALSSNVSVTTTDLSLNNVTNDAQTKAAVVPNTLTAHALYAGNTTSAISAISVPAADSLLYGTTAVDPSFKALPTTGTNGCSGSGDALQWNNSTHAFACVTGLGAGGSGTVNSGTAGHIAYYATSTTAVSDGTVVAADILAYHTPATGVAHTTSGSQAVTSGDVALGSETSGNYVADVTAGAGLKKTSSIGEGQTVDLAVDSTEADFLASGALTCGASTQGKMKVHTTPLQYCDNAATPTLRYSAYADSAGKATSAGTADSANAVTWANVNKATSSVADITTRTCSTLSDAGSGCSATIANYVPTSTTVNGHALSSNVSVTTTDLSLNNLTNDAQTKAAVVPNTAPSAGQIPCGNAGGTAYAPCTIGTDATLSSAGALTLRAGLNVKSCEIHIWGTGASSVLQDSDDEVASCLNKFGVTWTVTYVGCWANAGSPTVMITKTGGNNMLTGNLTCGTASWASGTLASGADKTTADGGTVDVTIVSAGGTATNIRMVIAGTI